MPLKMPVGQTDKYFIVGVSKLKKVGIALLRDQQVIVTSADPATVVITPDAVAGVTDADYTLLDGTAVPAGTATQQSGVVSSPAAPAQLNVPINVTLHLQNADGSPVLNNEGQPIADVVDTVTIVPVADLLESEGELFGTPV